MSRTSEADWAEGSRAGSWVEDGDEALPDQWCVEVEGSLACLSTRQVWMGLAQGRLTPTTPIWRDGLGHWAPIEAVPELTDEEAEERVSVPERSEIRARRRMTTPPPVSPPPELLRSGVARRASSVPAVVGAIVGVLLALPALVGAASSRLFGVLRRPALRKAARRSLAVSLSIGAVVGALAGVQHLRENDLARVPRAQRVAVDFAERARVLSARGRQSAAEAEQRFWGERWR
ncbi:MAG: DUF4339 domain-containing protein [Deltaproteobacteria bacterium]|nr:DUF4339 domain-containing protein [Deltaproteobacteria bacterium]